MYIQNSTSLPGKCYNYVKWFEIKNLACYEDIIDIKCLLSYSYKKSKWMVVILGILLLVIVMSIMWKENKLAKSDILQECCNSVLYEDKTFGWNT